MKVTVLGLGLMGKAMALRLIDQGHQVTGWNRHPERAVAAKKSGVAVTAELDRAVAQSNVLLITLSDAAAIEATLSSLTGGAPLREKQVIQMGTIAPEESRQIAQRVTAAGGRYLEAPVLGSIPEATAGTLIIMAGGDPLTYQRCLPLLLDLGSAPERVGEVGQGAALKLAMNQLIASLTIGFSMSLGLVRAEGLDVERFMSLLRSSALYAPTFDKKLGKMLSHDYANPNFPLKHLLKDVALFHRVADENGIDSRTLKAFESLLSSSGDEYDNEDYSALYELVNPASTTR